jgi:hypothetical protein
MTPGFKMPKVPVARMPVEVLAGGMWKVKAFRGLL